jgi:ribosome-binding protein aMBF1 (putative translation factor)
MERSLWVISSVVQLASSSDDAGMPAASPRFAHDPVLVAFGAAVRRARLEQGVSQEELADRAGVDRSYMSSLERGAQNPGLMAISKVAKALDLPIAHLMLDAEL